MNTNNLPPSIEDQIRASEYQTPYFVFQPTVLEDLLNRYRQALPTNTQIFYSMKSNSEEPLLRVLNKLGCGFEVSSLYELKLLDKLNVPPSKIIIGNSVNGIAHINSFVAYGIDRFAVDSAIELEKLAVHAPGAKVYIRVLVDDKADSVFTMSDKFGVTLDSVVELCMRAKKLGLVPFGLSFNVGSQAQNKNAWASGIKHLSNTITDLRRQGIKIEILNLGGGFPWQYNNEVKSPGIDTIGKLIREAIKQLPSDINFYVEPGRGISAHAYSLVTSVISKIRRPKGNWLYIDSGAYNALLETMKFQGSIRYNITTLKDFGGRELTNYILTGPTCDSLDVIDHNIELPSDLEIGDQLLISDVGAYSFVLSTAFNGFPTPPTYEL